MSTDTEKRLTAQLNKRSAIIDGALDGIVVIDDTGEVRDFNRAAEAMFGYSREEAVGAQIVDMIIPGIHRDQHLAGFHGYINGTSDAQMIGRRIETEARRKNGDIFPVELTIVEIPENGQPVFAGYLRDLTSRREIEAQVERQRAVIHQNEKLGSMGALLANVAHELNNPLSVVIGQAELLCERPVDDDVKRNTERILSAAQRCADIVHTFLAAARQKPPAQRSFPADQPPINSAELIEHSYQTDGIEFTRDIGPGLPALFGDDGQIAQVIANLLTNAQQALSGRPSPKRVALSARHDARTQSVVYAVADNGPGVPDELLGRIFEPFFTTKDEGSGTGVGLAIAHNIVTGHGGDLQVSRCRHLGGARFELRLPVGRADDDDAHMVNQQSAPDAIRPISVLVVDDDLDVAETIAELLAHMDVEIASTAEAALQKMERTQYDVILSDLRMPDVDGPAFFKTARQRWPECEKRFGFITGDSLNATAATFLRETDAPVVEKPLTRERLLALVTKVGEQAPH